MTPKTPTGGYAIPVRVHPEKIVAWVLRLGITALVALGQRELSQIETRLAKIESIELRVTALEVQRVADREFAQSITRRLERIEVAVTGVRTP